MAGPATGPAAPVKPPAPITVRGRYFWKDKQRFLINGVVYQPHRRERQYPLDPLADDQCDELQHSLSLFKELGLNTLFVYSIDPAKSHDASMDLLAKAGIYVIPCISSAQVAINRATPFNSYKASLLQHYFQIVEKMVRYPNTLGIVVASEVINNKLTSTAAPVIRAVVRDVKRYIALLKSKKGERIVPVGVTVADVRSLLKPQFDYFCSGPENEAVDFFAFNTFCWAGESSMQMSGYSKLVELFSETPIPVFLSEYGNNVYSPRTFFETRALYDDQGMYRTFSGGIVYEFFQGANRYGLVQRTTTEDGRHVRFKKLKDFQNLRASLRDTFMRLPDELIAAANEANSRLGKRPQPPQPDWTWAAMGQVPLAPLDWADIETQMKDEEEWVDVRKELLDLSLEDLTISMWERLNIEDV